MSDFKKAGKAVLAEEGGLESIKDLAAMMPARSLSRELLQKLGDDPTTYQVGRLVATLHSDMQANVESYHVLTDTASGSVPSSTVYATAESVKGQTFETADSRRFARAIGRSVLLYNGDVNAEYGFTQNGTIYVNANRGNVTTAVVAHELTHTLQGTKAYAELQTAIFESTAYEKYLEERGLTHDELLALKMRTNRVVNPGFSKSSAEYEVAADFMGNVLVHSEQHLTELARTKPKLFIKLRDLVRQLLAKLGIGENAEARRLESLFESTYRASFQTQKKTVNESGVQYSIVEPFIDNYGNVYDSAVLLDTEFFDGLSPRNWGRKLKNFVYKRSAEEPFIMPVVDEKGNRQIVEFAKIGERVSKNGGQSHLVLEELVRTQDNISKLSVIHIDEILEVSEENKPYYSSNNEHGWLDKNGWLHRNAYVINSRNGSIYNITLDIAKTADGRTLLYATNGKIKRVGQTKVSSLKTRDSTSYSNSTYSIPNPSENVKPSYSISDEVTSTEGVVDSEELHDIDPQRIRDAIAGKTRGVVDVRGLDTPTRSVSVDELIAASRAGMRRERYVAVENVENNIETKYNQNGALNKTVDTISSQATEKGKEHVVEIKNAFSLNGTLEADSIRRSVDVFAGKNASEYAVALEDLGYRVQVINSMRSTSGAQLIVVSNPSKERNVSQIQVSPGGGRHGDCPYVKISTTNIGRFKIVDGSRSEYKSNAKENAEIIFRRK